MPISHTTNVLLNESAGLLDLDTMTLADLLQQSQPRTDPRVNPQSRSTNPVQTLA